MIDPAHKSEPMSAAVANPSLSVRHWHERVTVVHVAAFAVAVQIIFLLLLPKPARINDSADFVRYYNPVAQNLLNGKGPVLDSGDFGTLYPAGFPVFLAGNYFLADLLHIQRTNFVLAANIFLTAVGCVFAFLIARRLFTPEIAVFSALLWATYIFNLWLVKQPNSEVPFVPLLLSAVYVLILAVEQQKARWAAASGFLLALAALIRPIAILLPAVFAAGLLVRTALRRRLRLSASALLIATFFLTVLPWEFEVYVHTGHVVPLSANGPSSILDGLTFARRSGTQGIPAPVLAVMREIWHQGKEVKGTADIVRVVKDEARQHPSAIARLYMLKVARSWYGTDSGSHERLILLVQLIYLAVSAAGCVMLYRRFENRRYWLAVFLVIVFYFWGMAVVALSILRYLVPAMPFLLIPAAAVPATLVEQVAAPEQR